MRLPKLPVALLAPVLLLNACASEVLGPTVGVMPAPGKPFDVFQGDQALCRQFASGEIQGGAQQANNRQVGTAVVGTLLGAGLGAALGGGRGAAIGAGAGALGGTAVGAGPSQDSQMSLQQRYDLAYSQCMYSRGNQVPGYQPVVVPPPPPPTGYSPGYPPPPPGYAPPPGLLPLIDAENITILLNNVPDDNRFCHRTGSTALCIGFRTI